MKLVIPGTILYIRTSTEEQHPENQIKDCESLLDGQYTLIEEKQSAYKDNKERKGFEKSKKLIKSGSIKHFVVWDLDRIYRNRKKLIEFFQYCKVYSCEIHSFNQQWLEQLHDIPEPFNEIMHGLMLNLMGWMAEDESKKKSSRVKLAVRKRKGKPTKSYKGNKWGRKSISKQKITKIKNCIKENPKMSLRNIAKEVGLSKSAVHKYIHQIQIKKVLKTNVFKLTD